MPVRRLDDAGLAAVAAAIADARVLARYRAKVATVPGSECLWWTGAVAGRSEHEGTDGGGHGRFWYAPGGVLIALCRHVVSTQATRDRGFVQNFWAWLSGERKRLKDAVVALAKSDLGGRVRLF